MSARNTLLLSTSLAALLLTAGAGSAQVSLPQPPVTLPPGVTLPAGSVVLNPASNGPLIVRPKSGVAAAGHAHSNALRLIPRNGFSQVKPQSGPKPKGEPPFTGYLFETPASLACVYELGVGGTSVGCNPNSVTTVASGGSKAIALVDAYHYPTATADLAKYSSQFGLPTANFTVIEGTGSSASACQSGSTPATSSGWNVEEAIDIEMAHAMAPSAHIYLVEAASNSFVDLFKAAQIASACVVAAGGGEVSMSFGGSEWSGETSYDSVFTSAGVLYFASAGDGPGVIYPSSSPNVIGVGGTTFARNQHTGFFESQATWNWGEYGGTGGGVSAFEAKPSYQSVIAPITAAYGASSFRAVPDLAALANPDTGIWVYSSSEVCGGWCVYGGTSVASPLLAGFFNFKGYFPTGSLAELTTIYQLGGEGRVSTYFTNINNGLCGPSGGSTYAAYEGFDPQWILATTNIPWNYCTGWGTPNDGFLLFRVGSGG